MRSFQWPEPKPVGFRLYHDDQGLPLVYTMEDLPGSYIEIDQATYIRGSHHVRVDSGRLIVLQPSVQVSKLQPDPLTGTPCDPRDICVVVSAEQPHTKWKKIINDIR